VIRIGSGATAERGNRTSGQETENGPEWRLDDLNGPAESSSATRRIGELVAGRRQGPTHGKARCGAEVVDEGVDRGGRALNSGTSIRPHGSMPTPMWCKISPSATNPKYTDRVQEHVSRSWPTTTSKAQAGRLRRSEMKVKRVPSSMTATRTVRGCRRVRAGRQEKAS